MKIQFAVVVGLSYIGHIVCNCTFPEHVQGSWISSTDSKWTANWTHITNLPLISETTGQTFSFSGIHYPVMDFECLNIEEDTKFHMRSSKQINVYGNYFLSLFLCLDIRMITEKKLKYYKATEPDRDGFRITADPNTTCLNTTLYTEFYNYSLALKSGFETTSRINCPDILFGNYRYNCSDNETVSNKTSMKVCDTRQQFIFDYSVCNITHMFSLNGTLDCVYYVNNYYNNVTYLTMYNQDSLTPEDEKTFYQFTCLAVQELSNTVYLTAYPQICIDGQTPTNISSPGEALVLEPYYLCPITSESSKNILPIILGAIGGLLLIAIITAVICICKRRKKRADEEQPLSKESDNEEEEKEKSTKMKSSKSEGEDKKSIDSGISEPDRADTEQRKDDRNSLVESLLANGKDHKSEDNKEEYDHIDEDKLKIENETKNKSDINTSNQEDNPQNKSDIEKENEQQNDTNSKDENTDSNKNDNDDREQEKTGKHGHKIDGDSCSKTGGETEQEKTKEKMLIGGMTTALVGREIGERKRMRMKQKNKKKMKKMARKKTRKHHENEAQQHSDLSEEITSSDDQRTSTTPIGAPFIKQYETKKHLEHILDEQHYWSDQDADKDDNNNENMYSDSFLNSNSDSEEDVIGLDGVTLWSRRIKELNVDDDELNSPDLDHTGKKVTYISGNLASVEDPNNVDQRNLRLNEHTQLKEYTNETDALKDVKKTSESKMNIEQTELNKLVAKKKSKSSEGKHKTIFVQEHSNGIGKSASSDKDGVRKRKDIHSQKTINSISVIDFYDTNISKLSDWDSGMDDDDEAVDVILTEEQQQMVVNMLFENEMKLRPEYGRDENGRIIRLLDNTAIYDPKTGRFIFRKRHGHLFKAPRLRRDVKGRPTGGYVDDALGPKSTEMQQENSDVNHTRRQSSNSSGSTAMAFSANTKRSSSESRSVGFDFPENDMEILPADNLEFNKRGRRDIVSAMRQKLNRRLFRKKKKQAGFAIPLSDVLVKGAWTEKVTNIMPPLTTTLRFGELGPLNTRFSRAGSWLDKRSPLTRDPEELQVYRDGLASDQKILQSIQAKNYKQPRRSTARDMLADGFAHDYRQSFENERLFTKVYGPADRQNDRNSTLDGAVSTEETSPMQLEDYFTDHSNQDGDIKTNCFSSRRSDSSQVRVIDDQRLKRLLEELYMDKKYFDHIVETTDPTSEATFVTKELAEHGREYLLRRADYWENRGPLPPRPPLTAHGWQMQRQQTIMESRQASVLGSTTTNTTLGKPNAAIPGVIESPREQRDATVDNQNINNVHSNEETSV